MSNIVVPIRSDADTVVARQRAREIALRIGLSRTDATFVATAVSEIARNITVHAGSGEVEMGPLTEDGRHGLVVIARDAGPGISDVEAVLREDFDGGAGLGVGLWGARRLMDDVTVASRAGEGTTVTMKKWCGSDEVGPLLAG